MTPRTEIRFPARTSPSVPRPSRGLIALVVLLVATGVASGAVSFAHRSAAPAVAAPGTSAWPVHIVLSALALVAVVTAVARNDLRRFASTPFSVRAARRVRLTARAAISSPRALVRLLVALPFMGTFLYGFWRAGEQVTAGLDPHFTANAWGGPSYLGAMYCHYLDGALIGTACVLVLHGLLLGRTGAELRGTR